MHCGADLFFWGSQTDTFFVTDVDKTPLAVAYMGTLRKSSEEVFRDVEKRLQASEGACSVCLLGYRAA